MIRETGARDYGDIEGLETELPVDRRERMARLLKPASVAQGYSFPQDVVLPTVRRPKQRTDAEMITMWLQTGRWPERFCD
jgi:hypothetical protein